MLLDSAEHPNTFPDFRSLGMPKIVAAVGAWHRGYRLDYNGQSLPYNAEAKDLTCAACGGCGHDRSRCTEPITGCGNDYAAKAEGPLRAWRLHRRATSTMVREKRAVTGSPNKGDHDTSCGYPLDLRRPAAPQGKALLLLELAGHVLRFTLDRIPTGSYTENEHLRKVNYSLSITRSTNAKEMLTFNQAPKHLSLFPPSSTCLTIIASCASTAFLQL